LWIRQGDVALLLCMWLVVAGLPAFAQSEKRAIAMVGQGDPNKFFPNGYWFLDSVGHQVYIFLQGYHGDSRWDAVDSANVDTIYACHEKMVARTPQVTKIYFNPVTVFTVQGCICSDSLLWTWDWISLSVYDWHGGYADWRLNVDSDLALCNGSYQPDTVSGQLGFCLPQTSQRLSRFDCDDIANWGIIGVNGHWLIDPIYDDPFHFQNGIAEVLYYGQNRKINEKGEFVE
jgi:hypothetical protein